MCLCLCFSPFSFLNPLKVGFAWTLSTVRLYILALDFVSRLIFFALACKYILSEEKKRKNDSLWTHQPKFRFCLCVFMSTIYFYRYDQSVSVNFIRNACFFLCNFHTIRCLCRYLTHWPLDWLICFFFALHNSRAHFQARFDFNRRWYRRVYVCRLIYCTFVRIRATHSS